MASFSRPMLTPIRRRVAESQCRWTAVTVCCTDENSDDTQENSFLWRIFAFEIIMVQIFNSKLFFKKTTRLFCSVTSNCMHASNFTSTLEFNFSLPFIKPLPSRLKPSTNHVIRGRHCNDSMCLCMCDTNNQIITSILLLLSYTPKTFDQLDRFSTSLLVQ